MGEARGEMPGVASGLGWEQRCGVEMGPHPLLPHPILSQGFCFVSVTSGAGSPENPRPQCPIIILCEEQEEEGGRVALGGSPHLQTDSERQSQWPPQPGSRRVAADGVSDRQPLPAPSANLGHNLPRRLRVRAASWSKAEAPGEGDRSACLLAGLLGL